MVNQVFGTQFNLSAFQALFDEKAPIKLLEAIITSLLGVFVAFTASYVNSNRLLIKLGQKVGATTRYDDIDVWGSFNADFKEKWVYVRDHKLNLLYYGWIALYSDSEKPRELLMKEVKVYNNNTGEYLYACEALYVAREKSELSIELPKLTTDTQVSPNHNNLLSDKETDNATDQSNHSNRESVS